DERSLPEWTSTQGLVEPSGPRIGSEDGDDQGTDALLGQPPGDGPDQPPADPLPLVGIEDVKDAQLPMGTAGAPQQLQSANLPPCGDSARSSFIPPDTARPPRRRSRCSSRLRPRQLRAAPRIGSVLSTHRHMSFVRDANILPRPRERVNRAVS